MPDVERAEAIQALLDRGINAPEALLQYGTPAQILTACHRWDRQEGVGAGLLVRWIRDSRFEEEPAPAPNKTAILHARFDAYARRYPAGTITETHTQLNARRWPDDLERNPCAGRMIVWDVAYPNISVECDACGLEADYPVRGLHVLGAALTSIPPGGVR